MDLPPSFADTRAALHAVAEHVLAAARYRAVGKIGLGATPGGFGTPRLRRHGAARRRAWTWSSSGATTRGGRRSPRCGRPAAFVGVEPGMPASVYTPRHAARPGPAAGRRRRLGAGPGRSGSPWSTTPCGPSPPSAECDDTEPDHDVARALRPGPVGGEGELRRVARRRRHRRALRLRRPVGSAARPATPAFWNQPFGAALGHDRIASSDDLVAFYRAGKAAAAAADGFGSHRCQIGLADSRRLADPHSPIRRGSRH